MLNNEKTNDILFENSINNSNIIINNSYFSEKNYSNTNPNKYFKISEPKILEIAKNLILTSQDYTENSYSKYNESISNKSDIDSIQNNKSIKKNNNMNNDESNNENDNFENKINDNSYLSYKTTNNKYKKININTDSLNNNILIENENFDKEEENNNNFTTNNLNSEEDNELKSSQIELQNNTEETIYNNFLNEQKIIYEKNRKENLYYLFNKNNTNNTTTSNYIKNSNLNTTLENYNNNNIFPRNFFTKIVDFDLLIDTYETYSKSWCEIISELYNYLESKNSSIQKISLGSQHTLCLSNDGKLFTFGWNNYSQCGIDNKKTEKKYKFYDKFEILNNIETINEIKNPNQNIKFINITAGEDHSLIIDENHNLFGFGLNTSGQLIINDKKIVKNIENLNTKNIFFNNEGIINIYSNNYYNFVLNESGNIYLWPWKDKKNNYFYSYPKKLKFLLTPSKKEKIFSFSCGNNFVVFLSVNGNLYSMGTNNKFGQLGLGHKNKVLHPTLIDYFININEKITQISCGFNHCLAKNNIGKIFSWGNGINGQLGLGNNYTIVTTPKKINFYEKVHNVYQISCGNRSSYFLTDYNNSIYMCGYDGSNHNIFLPIAFNLNNKIRELKNNKYWICRINNCWNKSFSIFYVTFLDCNLINIKDKKVNNVLNLINMKWIDQSFSNNIMEGMDNFNEYNYNNVHESNNYSKKISPIKISEEDN